MTNPLDANSALYYPIEIVSGVDWGPVVFTFGDQSEDVDGNLEYDDDGKPVQSVYDLTGYEVSGYIRSTSSSTSADFTVLTADLSGGEISISLSDTQTTEISEWKQTSKSTEKIGEYRIIFTYGGISKVKLYGPVSINTLGA